MCQVYLILLLEDLLLLFLHAPVTFVQLCSVYLVLLLFFLFCFVLFHFYLFVPFLLMYCVTDKACAFLFNHLPKKLVPFILGGGFYFLFFVFCIQE